jgi:hypothetical protein
LGALEYLEDYIQSLPVVSEKRVYILTDGIHDPPPDSPFNLDRESVDKRVHEITKILKGNVIDFSIISFPDYNTDRDTPVGEKQSNMKDLTEDLDTVPKELPRVGIEDNSTQISPPGDAKPDKTQDKYNERTPDMEQDRDSAQT